MGFFKRLFGLEKDEDKEVAFVPEIKEKPVVVSESANEPEPIAAPEPIVEPEPVIEPVAKLKPEVEPELEPESTIESVFVVEPEPTSEPNEEIESVTEPELIPTPEAIVGYKQEEPESTAVSETVTEPEPDIEPEPVTEPETVTESEFDTNSVLSKETYYSIAKVRVQGIDKLDEDDKEYIMNDLEEDTHVYLRNIFDDPKDCHTLQVLHHDNIIGYIDSKKAELIHSYLRNGKIGAIVVSKIKSKDFNLNYS